MREKWQKLVGIFDENYREDGGVAEHEEGRNGVDKTCVGVMVERGGGGGGGGSDASPLPERAPHTAGDVHGHLFRICVIWYSRCAA